MGYKSKSERSAITWLLFQAQEAQEVHNTRAGQLGKMLIARGVLGSMIIAPDIVRMSACSRTRFPAHGNVHEVCGPG